MEITGTINVTELSAVDKLNDTDTLLFIRKEGESQKCYRIAGSDFRGKSAYEVARDAGYEGTFVEWQEQVKTISKFTVSFDPKSGCLSIDS